MDKNVDKIVDNVRRGKDIFPDNALAAAHYDELAKQLGGADQMKPQQATMIEDVVRIEILQGELQKDIEKRGLGETARNGRQSYYRENKSVTLFMKLVDQKRHMLQALGLITKTKDQPDDMNDDGDFDKF